MDDDERAIVWSELDMMAAFYCFFLEPSWYHFQAVNKAVWGSPAAAFDSSLAEEPAVYPALRVMPTGWQSACGLLQYFHQRPCFLPPLLGAGLDPSRETRRDLPLPRTMDKSRQDFFTVYLDDFSQTELVHISELASAAESPTATAAFRAAWAAWEPPKQLGIEVFKQDEIDVLGARVSGRSREELLASSLLCRRGFARMSLAPSFKGKSWDGGFGPSSSTESSPQSSPVSGTEIHPEGLRPHRRLHIESMVDDVLLAILSLFVCVSDLRAKVSPLVAVTDAS